MANYTRPGMVGGSTPGNFVERMEELKKLVGTGKIQTTITVSQAYARRQHQSPNLRHPRGGHAFFLSQAFLAAQREHYQRVAQELFRGNTQAQFIKFGEKVARDSSKGSPIELGNLRNSDSVSVKVGGRTIYKRPARKPRMSKTELKARKRLPR